MTYWSPDPVDLLDLTLNHLYVWEKTSFTLVENSIFVFFRTLKWSFCVVLISVNQDLILCSVTVSLTLFTYSACFWKFLDVENEEDTIFYQDGCWGNTLSFWWSSSSKSFLTSSHNLSLLVRKPIFAQSTTHPTKMSSTFIPKTECGPQCLVDTTGYVYYRNLFLRVVLGIL